MISNPTPPMGNRYGAPMGRHTGPDYLATEAGPLYLRRIRLDRGGYDAGGAYWGLGEPLYYVEDQDGNAKFFRARSRDAAKAAIRADWPGARFYGEKDTRPGLPVIFRAEWAAQAGGAVHVTAVFPTLPDTSDPYTATCYAHVGQHSGCSRGWYRSTRAAKPDEFADLLRELRGIYERPDDPDAVRLIVARRWTKHHDAARRAELQRMREGVAQ